MFMMLLVDIRAIPFEILGGRMEKKICGGVREKIVALPIYLRAIPFEILRGE